MKVGQSRSSRTSWLVATSLAAALGIGGLASSAPADAIAFDPNGTPSATGNVVVNEFGNATGNALATGAQLLISTTPIGMTTAPFFTLYQARIDNVDVLGPGLNIFPGSGVPYGTTGIAPNYLTVVAGFWERARINPPDPANGVLGSVSFTSAGVPQTIADGALLDSFFEIYSETGTANDPGTFADDDTGVGFRDGTLILKATHIPGTSGGGFSVRDATTLPPLDSNNGGPIDSSDGAGDPDSVPTVIGGGGTPLNFVVTDVATNYFPGGLPFSPLILVATFAATNDAPFFSAEPSDGFYKDADSTTLAPVALGAAGRAVIAALGTATDTLPALGAFNGLGTGPDVQFQSRGSFSFTQQVQAVPEPGTISMALTGIGLTSLAVLRRRRRPAGPSAA